MSYPKNIRYPSYKNVTKNTDLRLHFLSNGSLGFGNFGYSSVIIAHLQYISVRFFCNWTATSERKLYVDRNNFLLQSDTHRKISKFQNLIVHLRYIALYVLVYYMFLGILIFVTVLIRASVADGQPWIKKYHITFYRKCEYKNPKEQMKTINTYSVKQNQSHIESCDL
jgi:hypothetical protein